MKKSQTAFLLATLMTVGFGVAQAQNLNGNVDYTYQNQMDGRLWGNSVVKSITLQPGRFQFSADKLGINDRVVLNLINPTNQPLQFETSKRLGKEVMAIIPPRSTRTVSFIYNKPMSDEVEYLVMTEAQAAIAGMNQPMAQQQPVAVRPAPVYYAPASSTTVYETQQAVRGYW